MCLFVGIDSASFGVWFVYPVDGWLILKTGFGAFCVVGEIDGRNAAEMPHIFGCVMWIFSWTSLGFP